MDEGAERNAKAVVMGFRLKDAGEYGISRATKNVLTHFKGEVILYRASRETSHIVLAPRSKVVRLSRHK